jgi:site-specific DNA-cytosine methylase
MTEKKLCIDLCAGLGGFSQAFKLNPEWDVITIDVLRKFKPTICCDIRYLPLKKNLKPEVLLASPPCQRFSIACPHWPKIGIKLAMELVGAVFECIPYLNPKYWLVENPMGRLRWFIGKPKQTIRYSDYELAYKIHKKTDLWGNIELPMPKFHRYFYQGHLESGWAKA